jgi:hypothetical protein
MEYRVYREQMTTTAMYRSMAASDMQVTYIAVAVRIASLMVIITITIIDNIIIYIRYQSNLEVLYNLYAVLLSILAPPVNVTFCGQTVTHPCP